MIASLAARQHGVVSRAQLIAAGMSVAAISHRVGSGRLHRLHQGVYAVGHTALSQHSRWLAAVLACGTGAALSHRSAAELYELLPRRGGWIDVTTTSQRGRTRRGITHHRTSFVAAVDVTTSESIPTTTPARTLRDLRATAAPTVFRRALDRAATKFDLPKDLRSTPGAERTRSELEREALRLIEQAGLPRPLVNHERGTKEFDLVWPEQRVIAELHGYAWHGGPGAFARDQRRLTDLQVNGWRALPFAPTDLFDTPEAFTGALARTLTSA